MNSCRWLKTSPTSHRSRRWIQCVYILTTFKSLKTYASDRFYQLLNLSDLIRWRWVQQLMYWHWRREFLQKLRKYVILEPWLAVNTNVFVDKFLCGTFGMVKVSLHDCILQNVISYSGIYFQYTLTIQVVSDHLCCMCTGIMKLNKHSVLTVTPHFWPRNQVKYYNTLSVTPRGHFLGVRSSITKTY